ncbi:hypothetical protein [Marinomonas sp. FW-1]|nr:hypothetical protein [Marinomonas sp. FW-1]
MNSRYCPDPKAAMVGVLGYRRIEQHKEAKDRKVNLIKSVVVASYYRY